MHAHWPSQVPMLSHFSCVQLCAAPETAAHQAPPSLGFSRQEPWSGLPFPSPTHESEGEVAHSCPTLRDPMDCMQPSRLLHPWDFPGKSTGEGCHCLLRKAGLHQTKELLHNEKRLPTERRKSLPTEWEKIFANIIAENSLIAQMYKELIQLNIK